MAGKSQRIKKMGLEVPKWNLKVDERSLLYWSINFVHKFAGKVVFVCLKEENADIEIREICKELNIGDFDIKELISSPSGQALSALIGAECLPENEPFAIWNVDTIVRDFEDFSIPNAGNWLTVCELPGDNWSFAEIQNNKIIRVTEKQRISNWTSIGLYGFESPLVFT